MNEVTMRKFPTSLHAYKDGFHDGVKFALERTYNELPRSIMEQIKQAAKEHEAKLSPE